MGQNFQLIINALLLFGAIQSASADEVLIVDQPISLAFSPEAAFALIEESPGQIRSVKADYAQTSGVRALEGTAREYLVATAIQSSVRELKAVFFIRGQESQFAATPVKNWTPTLLKFNSSTVDSLRERAIEVETKREQVETERLGLEKELLSLRNQASKIAGLDELIDLKTELERLKEMGEQRSVEKDRLQQLIEASKTMADLPESDTRRAELSDDLREIARVTAASEGIHAQKKKEAQAGIEEKLARIRMAQKYSPEELARYVLKLRSRRKELEGYLNIAPNEDEL